VAAVDLPGFGYSSRRQGLDHSQEARGRALWDLAARWDGELPLEALGLGWNLVGHSMGGGTIAAMALQAPSRVASLTLVAGAVYGRHPGPIGTILAFPPAARWLQVAARYYLLTPQRVKGFLTSAYGEEPPEAAVAGYLEPLALPGTVDTLIDMTRAARSLAPVDLKVITSPALLLWGDEDAWVPLAAGEELARTLPAAELVILRGTGHCPMETRPQEFNRVLLNFLQKRGAP
jgi:pimeloyl-ACP methyl ester carboxylesterase